MGCIANEIPEKSKRMFFTGLVVYYSSERH
jgi:hypothetical protein